MLRFLHLVIETAGHIGVGKSTEILHLANEMQSERFVVKCSIAQTLGVHNIDVFSLLIVVLEASIRSWIENLGEIPPELVEDLAGHVRNLIPETKKLVRRQKAVSGLEALFEMQSLFGEAPITLKTGKQLTKLYSEVLQRLALRYVSDELRSALDPSSIAMSCEVLLKELENAAGKPVLLVIDDLDKLRDERAQTDIFLDRAMAWIRLPCGVVATLPFDVWFSARGRELDQVWGEIQVLDPWPVPDLSEGGLHDELLKPYLALLRGMGAHGVFSALQCRNLAHAASGIPRSFIQAGSSCVRYALEAGEEHVKEYHVNLVLQDLTDRWRGRLIDSDYEALIGVLDSGGSNVPKAIQMLRDGILIRGENAKGEMRFRIANWAEPLLEAYRKRKNLQAENAPKKA